MKKISCTFSAILAYPSAAPVTTPSNKPNTGRISGLLSIDATKCISEVPGLAKITSKPLFTKVFIMRQMHSSKMSKVILRLD